MSIALSPLVSEFETIEQEASYTAWLQAKVAASLADHLCKKSQIFNLAIEPLNLS